MLDKHTYKQLFEWTQNSPSVKLLSPAGLDQAVKQLVDLGWSCELLGWTEHNHAFQALHYVPATVDYHVVAYGYPHPDEPIGATALYRLALAISEYPPPGLENIAWTFVLCADPDQAWVNNSWIENFSMHSYLRNSWHPTHLGLEIDYAFPIDYGPLYQPEGWSAPDMKPPRPESIMLAHLFEASQPDLVAMMHNEHTSGTYQFMSHLPPEIVTWFDQLNKDLKIASHRGERPDPGRRWILDRADWLQEPSLQEVIQQLEEQVGTIGSERYLGCVSAGQYIQSILPDTWILTPEVGMFEIPEIDKTKLCDQTRDVSISRDAHPKIDELAWVISGQVELPDASSESVVYHYILDSDIPEWLDELIAGGQTQANIPLTRGICGVEAIYKRRWWMQRMDNYWESVRHELEHDSLRMEQRGALQTSGKNLNSHDLYRYQTNNRYHAWATVAQTKDFDIRWNFQNARWIGHNLHLYQGHVLESQLEQDFALIISQLPKLKPLDIDKQTHSQIMRLLLCVAEHNSH